jgi:pimeloyl-ACP methyl ester carboxylesterase
MPTNYGISQAPEARGIMAGRTDRRLTVLLVHGAFCDTTLWLPVAAQLRAEGVVVRAPANPLTRLASDAAHVARLARATAGRVLLAGHAYGGAVITTAATQIDNVAGLVYITGYALEANESATDVDRRFPDTLLRMSLRSGVNLTIEPAAFPSVFAADLPMHAAEPLANRQRPIALACLTDPAPGAAWHDLPSWYLIATDDQCVHPQAQRFMADRAGSRISETAGSHAVAVSQPTAVADVVLTAARVVR